MYFFGVCYKKKFRRMFFHHKIKKKNNDTAEMSHRSVKKRDGSRRRNIDVKTVPEPQRYDGSGPYMPAPFGFRWMPGEWERWELSPFPDRYEMWIERPNVHSWEDYSPKDVPRNRVMIEFYIMCTYLSNMVYVGHETMEFSRRVFLDLESNLSAAEVEELDQCFLNGSERVKTFPLTSRRNPYFSEVEVTFIDDRTVVRFDTRHKMFDLLFALWKNKSPCLNTLRRAKIGRRVLPTYDDDMRVYMDFKRKRFVREKNGEIAGYMSEANDDWVIIN